SPGARAFSFKDLACVSGLFRRFPAGLARLGLAAKPAVAFAAHAHVLVTLRPRQSINPAPAFHISFNRAAVRSLPFRLFPLLRPIAVRARGLSDPNPDPIGAGRAFERAVGGEKPRCREYVAAAHELGGNVVFPAMAGGKAAAIVIGAAELATDAPLGERAGQRVPRRRIPAPRALHR